MVAQTTRSSTSLSGNTIRQGSRSSLMTENSFKSRATRARGISSSRIVAARMSMIALHAESERPGNHNPQVNTKSPVNLTSEPWKKHLMTLTGGGRDDKEKLE